jgi:sulfite exporter TauE/SafE
MQLPRLSSFTVIGAILIFIGIYGMASGPTFQYDLGVQADNKEGYYYLAVGVLMIVNGFFWLPASPEEKKEQQSSYKGASVANKK